MRAGDFISERMDVLERVVKKSISDYRSKRKSGLKPTTIDYHEYYDDYEDDDIDRNDDEYNEIGYQDYIDSYQYYYK